MINFTVSEGEEEDHEAILQQNGDQEVVDGGSVHTVRCFRLPKSVDQVVSIDQVLRDKCDEAKEGDHRADERVHRHHAECQ